MNPAGDKKEYELVIDVVNTDTWGSIIDKLNVEGEKLLVQDPDF